MVRRSGGTEYDVRIAPGQDSNPEPFDIFLRRTTFFYGVVVIFFMPGLVGLVAVLLPAYVLGGMYFIIDDMDRPIDYDGTSLINADITPLKDLNTLWETLPDSVDDDSSENETTNGDDD